MHSAMYGGPSKGPGAISWFVFVTRQQNHWLVVLGPGFAYSMYVDIFIKYLNSKTKSVNVYEKNVLQNLKLFKYLCDCKDFKSTCLVFKNASLSCITKIKDM